MFIRLLPSSTYFPEAKLSSAFLSSMFLKFQRVFIDNPKLFKDFFACRIVLAADQQYPGKIQGLSGQQSTAATSSSNQQQQSTAAISNQQQQSTAAINSTTSSYNQHSSYQQHLHKQRRHLLVITTVPGRGYIPLAVDLGLAAR